MITLKALQRKERGKQVVSLRGAGIIPAVLYGPHEKAGIILSVQRKEFEKVFKEAGESSLVSLEIENKATPVLIYDLQRDPISSQVTHVDFYQPPLDKEIEVTIPLVFEGQAPAVKDLGGTLIRNIQEVEVRALPQNLPHEIRVSVDTLSTFEDKILVRDLPAIANGKILRSQEDIIAQVVPPEKVEEELAKPVEEKIEEVGKVEKPKKEEEVLQEQEGAGLHPPQKK